MRKNWKQRLKRQIAVCMAGLFVLGMTACEKQGDTDRNLIQSEKRGNKNRKTL